MKLNIAQSLCRAVASAAIGLTPTVNALAADFPDKPLHFIVPYPAGGAADGAARIVAQRLSDVWKQPVVVENKPGASGRIGFAFVAKSPADGYTFVAITNSAIVDDIGRAGSDASFQLSRDLAPVALMFTSPVVFAVNTGLGINTLSDFIARAKAGTPGQYSYGSSGEGTSTHFFGEQFNKVSKIDLTHIPFAGDGPKLTSLLGGHVSSVFIGPATFINSAGSKQYDQTGKVKILAVAAPKRSALLPELPTFDELGVKGVGRDSWVGLFVPAATPAAVKEKIATDLARVLQETDVKDRFKTLGILAEGGTMRDFQATLDAERSYWTKAIRETGIVMK